MRAYRRARQLPLFLLDSVQALVICAAAFVIARAVVEGRYSLAALLLPAIILEVLFVYGTTVKEFYVDETCLTVTTLLGLKASFAKAELARVWMERPGWLWRELWLWGDGPLAFMVYGGPLHPFSRADCDKLHRLLFEYGLVRSYASGSPAGAEDKPF